METRMFMLSGDQFNPAESRRRMEIAVERWAECEVGLIRLVESIKIDPPAGACLWRRRGKRTHRYAHFHSPNARRFVDRHCRFHSTAPGKIFVGRVDDQIELFAIWRPFVF